MKNKKGMSHIFYGSCGAMLVLGALSWLIAIAGWALFFWKVPEYRQLFLYLVSIGCVAGGISGYLIYRLFPNSRHFITFLLTAIVSVVATVFAVQFIADNLLNSDTGRLTLWLYSSGLILVGVLLSLTVAKIAVKMRRSIFQQK